MRSPAFPLVVLLLSAAAAAQSDTDFEGQTIVGLEFNPSAQPLPAEELDHILGLARGSALHMADVRQAIENLYRTGRYHDIAIEARAEPGGVTLRIATEFNFFTSGVNIEGEADPPNRDQLAAATKLELGAPFAESQIEQAERNIKDRLRANGFYSAEVQSRVARTPATEEASIYFALHTGDRARFDGVKLVGDFSPSPARLIRVTGWRRSFLFVQFPGWRELIESRLQTGLGKVRESLQKGNHLQARVTLEQLEFHPATNRVTPTLRIVSGPSLDVKITGAELSTGQLRQLIPIFQERAVDRSLLLEGQRNLTEYFQSLGYFDATVELPGGAAGDPQETAATAVDYNVTLGIRHKLVNIGIAGNHYFSTEILRERLSMTKAQFLRYRWGRFSRRLMDQDKSTIEDLYRANGFREVEVTIPDPIDNYKGVPGHLSVEIQVKEGKQWFVDKLEIDGVPEADVTYLRSLLQSTAGEPFSEATVAADRDAVLSYYYNNGYPDASFDWTQTPGPAPNQVDLRFMIRIGQRQYVREVLVRGLETTNRTLVTNRISLAPSGPISQSRIAQSQQKLYDLGIFSQVQTAIQNPDGDEDSKYVLFHLEEAKKYSFNAGIGAELARIGGGVTTFDAPAGTTGFSPRVSLGLSRLNFRGLGHTVGVQTLASTLEQRGLVTYLAPQFTGNENLSLSVSGLFDHSRDVRTFTAERAEGSVQLAQRLSKANTIQYRYTFRHVIIPESTLKISPELVPLLSQPVRVGQFSLSFIEDRRDDPADSHRGFLNTADLGYAWSKFGSQTDFTRLVLRNSTYHRIGRDLVLARSLQFGYIQRWGGLSQIPLAERFFSGGASTHRGFPDNQAGPRDLETGFPLGGSALLFHSTELRFPLIGDNVGGVLFHDMGNVYSDVSHISMRFRQRNNQDFNYGVHAIGFGVRYRTPVGPIRADISFSPNSPRFVGFSGTRDQLLAGQGTPNVPQRINIFQFHFSLGQTF